MWFKYVSFAILALLCCERISAQHIHPDTQKILDKVEQLQLQNQQEDAIRILETGIKSTTSPEDLAYLYAYQSSIYTVMDSLLLSKKLVDLSLENAEKSKRKTSLAVSYRAKAFLNNALNLPDAVVKDALYALKQVENNEEDLSTKYHLNYLLYGAYSKWDDSEKMEHYIRQSRYCAIKANNVNLQTNVNNGISSMYLARYKKIKSEIS